MSCAGRLAAAPGFTARRAIVAAALVFAAAKPGSGQPEPGYEVSVGRLTVSRVTWDAFSGADFKVTIRRWDPTTAARLTGLEERMHELRDETGELQAEVRRLQQKDAASRVVPGPSLTDAERALRSRLSAMPVSERSASEVRDLQRLDRKDEESKRRPGPPLSAAEAARLSEVQERQTRLEAELQEAGDAHRRALALVLGHTRTLTSDSRTLDFDSGPLLTVYEGDGLLVTVVDEDVANDDLVGQHAFAVTRESLVAGSVDLGHASAIRSLVLRFAPSGR